MEHLRIGLVLLLFLTCNCRGDHPDGISKRQIGGAEACMHIYSVPRTLTRCEPTEETLNQLNQLREGISEGSVNLEGLRARVDELDPNQPKQLPEDVQRRLETVDEVMATQAGHSEFLRRLDSDNDHLLDRLEKVESSDKTEMSRLIELQTHLVEMTLRHSNTSLHEEYVDQLADSTRDLLHRLQQLELDFQERVHMAEASLDADLKRTEDLSRDSLDQLRGRVNDALLRLEEKLSKEVLDRLDYHNQTAFTAKLVERLEAQLHKMTERQAQYDSQEGQLREKVAQLQTNLAVEGEEKQALVTALGQLQQDVLQLRAEIGGTTGNQTEGLRQQLKELVDVVDNRRHLSPRTLKVVDCQDALTYYHPVSGIYDINPFPHTQPFEVYCEMDGTTEEGWTVIQRRQDGSEDFFRGWQDYKNGFGDIGGEHWLGLQKIHGLTNRRKYRLRVEMQDWDGKWWNAEYEHFFLDGEDLKYRLHISGYHGNAGDSLAYHNNMPFSTMDNNNDDNEGICATWCHGAWWFKSCFQSNLNGRYYQQGPYTTDTSWGDGVVWRHIHGTNYYSTKSVVMKIKAHDHHGRS